MDSEARGSRRGREKEMNNKESAVTFEVARGRDWEVKTQRSWTQEEPSVNETEGKARNQRNALAFIYQSRHLMHTMKASVNICARDSGCVRAPARAWRARARARKRSCVRSCARRFRAHERVR
eukprot:2098490-Pleurochrysis_carterae.AAC.1